ncbi:MAG TPA: hotdog domain-containing protein [Acidimicrobiales bacterium]|nr:hotdog domain-containing protein [Acidimicrobiales bacterium]
MSVEAVRRMGVVAGIDPPEARMIVLPALSDAAGVPRVGVLAALADSVTGVHALEVLDCEAALTADLAVHSAGVPVAPGTVLAATSRLLKRRRRGAVFQVEVADGEHRVATATVTYSTAGEGAVRVPEAMTEPATEPWPPDDLCTSVDELLPLDEAADGGGMELAVDEVTCNNFGVLAGGAIGMAADVAAARTAGRLLDGDATVTDLVVHFLAPGRVGPVAIRTDVVAPGPDRVSLRITMTDRGDGDRLLVAATAGACRSRVARDLVP